MNPGPVAGLHLRGFVCAENIWGGKNDVKKDIAVEFQKNLLEPREDKTPNHITRFISLGCSTSIAEPLQRLLWFSLCANGKA